MVARLRGSGEYRHWAAWARIVNNVKKPQSLTEITSTDFDDDLRASKPAR